METANKEIVIPLDNIKNLFVTPDYNPLTNNHLAVSGIEYAKKQLRMRPLEKVKLKLILPKGSQSPNLSEIKIALKKHCKNIVQEKTNDLNYLNWQIKRNFYRAVPLLALAIFAVGAIMYYTEDRSKLVQILLLFLNNCLIIIGWVLLWIPGEMFLYDAPRLKREIAVYNTLKNADVALEH